MPYISDIVKNTSLMFVNTHYTLSGPKPLSPSVVEIGGVHMQSLKTLDSVSKYRGIV